MTPEQLNEARAVWQPIETAPKDRTRFLALWPYSETQAAFETLWDDDESQGDKPGWWAPEWSHILDGYAPIGWMPLPVPPTILQEHPNG